MFCFVCVCFYFVLEQLYNLNLAKPNELITSTALHLQKRQPSVRQSRREKKSRIIAGPQMSRRQNEQNLLMQLEAAVKRVVNSVSRW